ncbi:hypothetical protein PG990_006795 [Apiospora arundinis]
MASSSSSSSISQRCYDIKQALLDLGDASEDDVARKISDLLARFELWAGNLGAFQQPWKRLSLDARVAQSPDIRKEILRHLDKIEQAASELKTLLETTPSGEAHCDEDDRDSPFDECGILVEVISLSLGFLFRLAVLVRAPGSDSRWSRATQRTDPIPYHFDYNHVISKYPYMDSGAGRHLAKRVAQANVRRRQFVQYCRDHVANLRAETRPANDGATEVVSSKATTLAPAMDLNALALEEFDDEVESLMTASTTFDKDTKLRLPLLASLSPDGEAFQCPICCALEQFDREKAWKMHAYRDLRAYSCTIGGKDCETKMFGDRKSWFDHEVTQHRSQFTCTLCSQKCQDKSATKKHISKSHGIHLPDQLSMLADSGRTVPTHFEASDCPFCDWPLERRRKRGGSDQTQDERVSRAELKRHIAMHQEQLALFVAPLGDDVEDDAVDPDESAEEISHETSPAASVDDNIDSLRPDEASLADEGPPIAQENMDGEPVIPSTRQHHGSSPKQLPDLPPPPPEEELPLDLLFKNPKNVENEETERSPREHADVSRSEVEATEALRLVAEFDLEEARKASLLQTEREQRTVEIERKPLAERVRLGKQLDEVVARTVSLPTMEEEEVEEEAREAAEKAKDAKQFAPIRFKDVFGRKFSFPWHICRTWEGMEELIKQTFLHVDVIGPHVQAGHYDLLTSDGEIILPQVWDKVIEPDWEISMHMWPMGETPHISMPALAPSTRATTSGSRTSKMTQTPGILPDHGRLSPFSAGPSQRRRPVKPRRPGRAVRPFKFGPSMSSEPGKPSANKKENRGLDIEKSTETEGASSNAPPVVAGDQSSD